MSIAHDICGGLADAGSINRPAGNALFRPPPLAISQEKLYQNALQQFCSVHVCSATARATTASTSSTRRFTPGGIGSHVNVAVGQSNPTTTEKLPAPS